MDNRFFYTDLEQLGELRRCNGTAKEVALPLGAVLGLEVGFLRFRFDTLRNDEVLETFAHTDDGVYDGAVAGIASDAAHEGLVNFQAVEGKLLEIAEAGIAGAEIIDGQMYAHGLKLLKYGGGRFGILHKNAFGEFEVEKVG